MGASLETMPFEDKGWETVSGKEAWLKFSELNLKPEILKGLEAMGYKELTPVQEQTFGPIRSGRDLLARAQTGSGKTSACAIPLVERIDPANRVVQGLILVPTRELAVQYVGEIAKVAKFTEVAPFAVYGGFSASIQRSKLEHGVHILVATPGRLIDLLYNSPLRLNEVHTFVLDEADEMLKMGFIEDVEFIFSCLVHEHQTLLFSATMPEEIKRITRKYLRNPVMVELNIEQVAPSELEHWFVVVEPRHRYERLREYLREEQPKQAILFCNSRLKCERLYKHLRDEFSSVEIIHGGLEQARRTSLFNRFRGEKIKYMVATDVASRGLDFSYVSHVINFDFPGIGEAYTHRTGRTARMGRKGKALTLVSRGDLRGVKHLLAKNHLTALWLGEKPDMSKLSGG
ncbi:MAG: DEAD/DEAH box helicase, partial [Sedimentisphaerales bacterium]|nr:DEAD/DEAH box helicase [Sedimentisphaerales bacterium]